MNKMKIFCTGLICCLALSVSAQSMIGKWKMEVPTDEGTAVIAVNIQDNGTYSLDFGADGAIEINGKYSMSGDTMTFSDDGECKGTGVYNVKATSTTLTMTRISDECSNRGGPEGVMVAKRM